MNIFESQDDTFGSIMKHIREEGAQEAVGAESLNKVLQEKKEDEKETTPAPQNVKTIKEPVVNPEDMGLENYDKDDMNDPKKKVKSQTPKNPKYAIKEVPKKLGDQVLKDSKQVLYLCNNCFETFRNHEAVCTHCFCNVESLIERVVSEEVNEDSGVQIKRTPIENGTVIVVRRGNSYTMVLHPEHQELIRKEYSGSFKDEQGETWEFNKEGNQINFKSAGKYFELQASDILESKVQERGSMLSGYSVKQENGKWYILNKGEKLAGPFDEEYEAQEQKEDFEDSNESKMVKGLNNFEKGDEVESNIFGKIRKGVIKQIHDLGDMADVDFGNGDIYGIHFNRMKKISK